MRDKACGALGSASRFLEMSDVAPAGHPPKQPSSRAAEIADILRDDIASGRLRCGDRIKELPLAQRFGVPRGPVREAIHLVAEEGLLEVRRNQGASVTRPAISDILEVYAIRASLGSLALRRLAIEPARIDLRPLHACLRTFRGAVSAGEQSGAVNADLQFQDEVVRLSGLRRAERTFCQLSNIIRMFISSLEVTYDLQSIYDDVDGLYRAIAARNLRTAEELWRAKFERCMRDFVDYLPNGELDPSLWYALTQSDQPPPPGHVDNVASPRPTAGAHTLTP